MRYHGVMNFKDQQGYSLVEIGVFLLLVAIAAAVILTLA